MKRQGNVASALLSNFDIARESFQTAQYNSGGSAERELDNWNKGIEASISRFKSAFQDLSHSTISSDLFKGVVDSGTAFVNVLTQIIDKFGLLTTVGGLVGGTKLATGFFGNLGQFANVGKFMKAGTDLTKLTNIAKSIGDLQQASNAVSTLKGLKNAEKIAVLVGSGLAQSADEARIALGLINETGAATAGVTGKIKMMGNALLGALVTHPILSAIAAITALGTAIFAIRKQQKENSIEQATEATKSWEQTMSNIQGKISEYTDLKIKLDTEDLSESEIIETKQQILSLQSEIVSMYGEQASGIDLVNGSLETQKQKLEAILQKNAENNLNQNNNVYQNAVDEMNRSDRKYQIGYLDNTLYGNSSSRVGTDLQKLIQKYESRGFGTTTDALGDRSIFYTGDAVKADETINDFMNDLRELQSLYKEIGDDKSANIIDKFLQGSADALTKNQKVLNDYEANYRSFLEQTMYAEGKGSLMTDLETATKDYNDALLSGNEEKIRQTAKAYYDLIDAKNEYVSGKSVSDQAGYNRIFDEITSGLDENTVKLHDFSQIVDGTTKHLDTNIFKEQSKDIREYAKTLSDAEYDVADVQEMLSLLFSDETLATYPLTEAQEAILGLAEILGITSDSGMEGFEQMAEFLGQVGVVADGTSEKINNLYDKINKVNLESNEKFDAIAQASETKNPGDDYRQAYTYFEETQELLKNNQFNTDDFKTRAAYFSPTGATDPTNFIENMPKIQRYLKKEASDISGLQNFLDDLQSKGYATFETLSDGTKQWSYDIEDLEQCADDMGIGFEFMMDIFNRLNEAGFSNNFVADIETGAKRVTDLSKELVQAEAELAELESKGQYSTVDEHGNAQMTKGNQTAIDEKRKQIQQLKQDILETQNAMDQLLEHSAQDYNDQVTRATEIINSMKQSVTDIVSSGEFGENTDSIVAMMTEEIQAIASKYHIELDADLNVLTNQADVEASIKEYQTQLSELNLQTDSNIFDFDAAEMSSSELKAKIEELSNMTIDPEVSPEGADLLDRLIKQCEKEYQLKINAEFSDSMQQANLIVESINQEIARIQSENKVLTISAIIDGSEEIQTLADNLASLPPEVQTSIGVDEGNVGNATAILDQLKTAPDSLHVNANVTGADQVNNLVQTANALNNKSVMYSASAVTSHAQSLLNIQNALHNKTVIYTAITQSQGSLAGKGPRYQGTLAAHANGTAYNVLNMNAYARGTNVALPNNEQALVNELGQESVIRDGQWFLLPGKMHIENLKKNDIILNAKQTKDLLEHGKTNSHARAYASGTVDNLKYLTSSYAGGTGGGSFYTPPTVSYQAQQANTDVLKSNTDAVKTNTTKVKQSTSIFDWVSTRLKRFASNTERIAKQITDYVSFATKSALLQQQMKSIDTEIVANAKGYETYMQKAQATAKDFTYYDSDKNAKHVSIPQKYLNKVHSGEWSIETMDTSTDAGKGLAEAIKQYQDYYESAMDCKDAIIDLENEQLKIYEQWVNIPAEKASKTVEKLSKQFSQLSDILSTLDVGGSAFDKLASIIEKDTGLSSASKKVKEAQQDKKEAGEDVKKAEKATDTSASRLIKELKNSASANTQKRVQQAIKNERLVNTKGLKGNDLTAAQNYNENLKKERKAYEKLSKTSKQEYNARQDYQSKKSSLTKTEQLILNNRNNDKTYVAQNQLLNEQVKNMQQQNKENQKAEKEQQKKYDAQVERTKKATNLRENQGDKLLNSLNLSDAQKKRVQSGKTLLEKNFTGADLKMVQKYNSLIKDETKEKQKQEIALEALQEASEKAVESEIELAKLIVENAVKKFDNIEEYYESKNQLNADKTSQLELQNELKKANGQALNGQDIKNVINSKKQEKSGLQEEKNALQKQLNSTTLKKGSKEWNDILHRINEVDKSMAQLDIEIVGLNKDLQNLGVERLTKDVNVLEADSNVKEAELDLKRTQGKSLTKSDYQSVIDSNNKEIAKQRELNQKNLDLYKKEKNAGNTDIAKDYLIAYKEGKAKEIALQKENVEYEKSIQELELERMNNEQGLLDASKSLVESMIALKEAQGKYLDKTDYEQQKGINNELIGLYGEQGKEYQNLAAKERADGNDLAALQYDIKAKESQANANNLQADNYRIDKQMRELDLQIYARQKEAFEATQNYIKSIVSLKEAEGKYLSEEDYAQQIAQNNAIIAQQMAMNLEYEKLYYQALAENNMALADEYFAKWKNGLATVNNLTIENVKLSKQAQEATIKRLSDEMSLSSARLKYAQSFLSLAQAAGKDLTASDYAKQQSELYSQKGIEQSMASEYWRLAEKERLAGNDADYMKYLTNYYNSMANVNDIQKQIIETEKDIQNLMLTKFEKEIELLNSEKSLIDSLVSLSQAEGKYLTEADYQKQIDANKKIATQQHIVADESFRLAEVEKSKQNYSAMKDYIIKGNNALAEANNIYAENATLQKEMQEIALTRLEVEKSILDVQQQIVDSYVSMKKAKGEYLSVGDYTSRQDEISKNIAKQEQINNENKRLYFLEKGRGNDSAADQYYLEYQQGIVTVNNLKEQSISLDKELQNLSLDRLEIELSILEANKKVVDSMITLKEAQGKSVGSIDYSKQLAENNKMLEKQRAINEQNLKLHEKERNAGNMAIADEYWNAYLNGVASVNNMLADNAELNKALADIVIDRTQKELELVQANKQLLDSIISLKEAEGKYLDASDYQEQISGNYAEIEKQRILSAENLANFNEAKAQGNDEFARQYYNEYLNAETEINNLLADNAKLQKEIRDIVLNRLQREQELLESELEVTKSLIELKEKQGIDLERDDYTKQIEMNNQRIASQQRINQENLARYNSELANKNLAFADEYLKAYNEGVSKVNELLGANEELKDSLREEVLYRYFTKALEKAELLRNVLSGINGLIDEQMQFDKDGNRTAFGTASLALSIKEYESNLDSIATLKKKREQIINDYNDGFNDTGYSKNEFESDLNDITTEMLSLLSNASSLRQTIVSMATKQYQTELDKINDLIDARRELLEKQKEYYDYDKSLKAKTKDIQLLEQQIAALEGVADAESRAKKIRLEAQREELQEDLDDTIKEHQISLQIEGLDELKETLQENYENYVDELNQNLETIIETIKETTDSINGCLGSVGETIQKLLASYGLSSSDLGLKEYASGTKNVPYDMLALTNEKGREIITTKNGILTPLKAGDGVIPNNLTEKLYDIAMNYDKLKTNNANLSDTNVNYHGGNVTVSYGSLLNVQGDVSKDSLPDLQEILRQSYKYSMNELRKDMRKSGNKWTL